MYWFLQRVIFLVPIIVDGIGFYVRNQLLIHPTLIMLQYKLLLILLLLLSWGLTSVQPRTKQIIIST